jgi:multidrug efflux pump
MVGLSGSLPMMQLQDIAEEVADILEDINGISEVDIQGKREREIWVELNPQRMATYGIGTQEVARTIANRVRNLPGGAVEMGPYETAIRMLGEPDAPEALSGLVLKSVNGGTVYLSDIARVTPWRRLVSLPI